MPPSSEDNKITVTEPSGAIVEAQRELVALDERAQERAERTIPVNTRRAYELELACFASWCARHGVRPTPVEPRVLRGYLEELAERGRDKADVPKGRPRGPLGYSSLMRALAAICRSQQKAGHPSPWKHEIIESARDTFARDLGTAPKKQKRAIEATGEELLLFRVCDLMGEDIRGVRDRAMLLVGWSSGRRRSEITAARVEHFTEIEEGIRWLIPRSKADQLGKGLVVLMKPSDDKRYCPVLALRKWLAVSKIESGPVFRGVDMNTGKIADVALAPEGVSRRIQRYVETLGLDPSDFGGHSLRSVEGRTGDLRWSRDSGTPTVALLGSSRLDHVIVQSEVETLALAGDGRVVWRLAHSDVITGAELVGGRLVLTAWGGTLLTIDPVSGREAVA